MSKVKRKYSESQRVRNWVGLADSIDGSGMSRYDHMLEDVLAQIKGEHPQHSITEFDRAEGAAGW